MDKCETCVWYVYDEDYDDYICDMDLDEDELARFLLVPPKKTPPIGWCFLFSAVPRQASRLRRHSSAAVPV